MDKADNKDIKDTKIVEDKEKTFAWCQPSQAVGSASTTPPTSGTGEVTPEEE